jgi:hypothetical protein
MKQKTLRKKIFLFLLALIGFAGMRAQTCSAPSTVATNGNWRGLDSFNVNERWHIIAATHDNYKIKL